ncbi:MarR family winged helix-turn-helix transcriptional regulator [Agaribacterium haliotis]|uniref:MarR family winged helix-turn-helix transcriptional regulator n=1 Tax=Agaribacterium haliotis TaxID=2013869 RepID=UPI000BB54ED4|nr:MarR family winged helix-turn-helix transcriptional regulator [Agaribacterium haliotis]
MVESLSLQLVQQAGQLNDSISHFLSQKLVAKGYQAITPSLLGFLSTLECGSNYGSELARKLGVSRQMVAKTVRELCALGYLEQLDGPGKQKQIVFTDRGEQLIAHARQCLAEIDQGLFKQMGTGQVQAVVEQLKSINAYIDSTAPSTKP